jgi:hypothetical protein
MRRLPAHDSGRPVRSGAPASSRGVLSDIRLFLVNRPAIPTRVHSDTRPEREDHSQRILQRLGIDVSQYGVLNIHRIGVAAPARLVFEELRRQTVIETCWPRHLAALQPMDDGFEHVRVFLLGRRERLFGLRSGFLGLDFIPLFKLDILKVQDCPSPTEVDNARFLLYSCSGGYPIGILGIYVRSSIPAQGEAEQSQVFFVVSFDFFGRKGWLVTSVVKRLWERIHDRATANMVNRFKGLSEARFDALREGRRTVETAQSP